MTTSSPIARPALLALAAAGLLSACATSDEFRLERRVVVDSDADSGTVLAGMEAVDLSACGDTWVNRAHLKGVAVKGVQATVLTVDGDNKAAHATGSLALRPEGAPADGSRDVPLGDFKDVALKPGVTISLDASNAAGQLLEQALQGSGRVALVIQGQADRTPAGFALKVALDVRTRFAPLGKL